MLSSSVFNGRERLVFIHVQLYICFGNFAFSPSKGNEKTNESVMMTTESTGLAAIRSYSYRLRTPSPLVAKVVASCWRYPGFPVIDGHGKEKEPHVAPRGANANNNDCVR